MKLITSSMKRRKKEVHDDDLKGDKNSCSFFFFVLDEEEEKEEISLNKGNCQWFWIFALLSSNKENEGEEEKISK